MQVTPIDVRALKPDGTGLSTATLAQMEEAIAKSEKPLHADLIRVLQEHTIAELIDNDGDRVLATLVDHPVYHSYGADMRVPERLDGKPEVLAFYEQLFAGGSDIRGLDMETIVVDDSTICMAGTTLIALQFVLESRPDFVPEADRGRVGFARLPMSVVIPFDGLLMVGENQFFGGLKSDGVVYVD
jgi:hypothetical protein